MLEVPQEIKSSWLNFYEGHDSEIDGSFSSVEAAVTKKANNVLEANNATGRRILKILDKKTNHYFVHIDTPLKHFDVLLPSVSKKQTQNTKNKAGYTAIQSRTVRQEQLGIQKCDGRRDGPTYRLTN